MNKSNTVKRNNVTLKYKDAFVAFIDVLGFKNMVKKDKTKINLYFSIVENKLEELKRRPLKGKLEYIIISDSVILSIPITGIKEEDIHALRQIIISIKEIQYELALNNIWIRGAITSGETHFDSKKHQVVGQAFINAYELEGKLAKYSRVIIDSKLVNTFKFISSQDFIDSLNKTKDEKERLTNNGVDKKDYSTYNNVIYDWNSGKYVAENIIKRDVGFFIDYMTEPFKIFNEEFEATMLSSCNLNKLINLIKDNMYDDASNYEKYRWVADYIISIYQRGHITLNVRQLLNEKLNEVEVIVERIKAI